MRMFSPPPLKATFRV